MAADCKSAAPCGLRRFESSPVHETGVRMEKAHVAQLVERVLGKDEVTSSILVVGSWAGVTQWLESRPSKPLVAGSNPVSRSSKLKGDLLELNRRRRYGEREV